MAERVILYIDDDPEEVRIMELSFERVKVQHALHVANGGREAIDRLQNAGRFVDRALYPVPEIILLDIRMPEMNGFDVLKVIKEQPETRHIPVFLLTSAQDPRFKQLATDLGAIGYIEKRWNLRSFLASLAYINTRLMAALKYNLLLQYNDHDAGMTEPPPANL